MQQKKKKKRNCTLQWYDKESQKDKAQEPSTSQLLEVTKNTITKLYMSKECFEWRKWFFRIETYFF